MNHIQGTKAAKKSGKTRKPALKILAGTLAAVCVTGIVMLSESRALGDTSSSGDMVQQLKLVNTNLTLALTYLNEWLITPSSSSTDTTGRLQSDFATYTNNILNLQQTGNTLQQ